MIDRAEMLRPAASAAAMPFTNGLKFPETIERTPCLRRTENQQWFGLAALRHLR